METVLDRKGKSGNLAGGSMKKLPTYNEIEGKGLMIKDKYRIERKVSEGSYGPLYYGSHIEKEQSVLIKFVSCKPNT